MEEKIYIHRRWIGEKKRRIETGSRGVCVCLVSRRMRTCEQKRHIDEQYKNARW